MFKIGDKVMLNPDFEPKTGYEKTLYLKYKGRTATIKDILYEKKYLDVDIDNASYWEMRLVIPIKERNEI